MKALLVLANNLALSALLLTAQAQTPATSHDNPTPATPTLKAAAATKSSKTIGQKMVQKSRPTDAILTRREELLPQKVNKK
jgi:hypothetical protein